LNDISVFSITTATIFQDINENFAPNPQMQQFVTAGAPNEYDIRVNSGAVRVCNWVIDYLIDVKTLP
jgi:hypothetical protein